jgi:hypothetical protein
VLTTASASPSTVPCISLAISPAVNFIKSKSMKIQGIGYRG